MRFFVPALSLLAAVASAQSAACNTNCITNPPGGLQVRAGQSFTLQWGNTSNGQVTIKLQIGTTDITPTSGITLATNVDARTGSYVVQIPSNLPASSSFTFEIIDSANPNVYNFSPPFSIAGATGSVTSASSTGTSASSATRTSGSSTSGSSSSVTAQSSSSSTDSTSATRTSTMTSSRTSSSAGATSSTAAPNSNTNGASSLKIEGAALALIAAVAGLL